MYISIILRRLRSSLLLFLLVGSVNLVSPGTFQNAFGAEEFPVREIRMIVPYNPGGVTDLAARIVADKVSKILGVVIFVVNNTAGGGTVGPLTVSQAKPDGYTLLATNAGQIIMKPMLNPEIGFRYTDVTPICRIFTVPFSLFVRNEAPWKNLKELIEHGKKNPGTLRASGGPADSSFNILLQMLKAEAGIDMAIIPTAGGTAVSAALLGGHAELSIDSIGMGAPFMRSGRLRALASTDNIKEFPALKTFAEQGLSRVSLKEWGGIYGPKGLPKAIVTKLTKACEQALIDPSVLEQMGKLYAVPIYQDPDELSKALDSLQVSLHDSLKGFGRIK